MLASSEGMWGVKRAALKSHRPDLEPGPFTDLQVTSSFLGPVWFFIRVWN